MIKKNLRLVILSAIIFSLLSVLSVQASVSDEAEKNVYVVLTNNNGAVNGLYYTTKLTFKFER